MESTDKVTAVAKLVEEFKLTPRETKLTALVWQCADNMTIDYDKLATLYGTSKSTAQSIWGATKRKWTGFAQQLTATNDGAKDAAPDAAPASAPADDAQEGKKPTVSRKRAKRTTKKVDAEPSTVVQGKKRKAGAVENDTQSDENPAVPTKAKKPRARKRAKTADESGGDGEDPAPAKVEKQVAAPTKRKVLVTKPDAESQDTEPDAAVSD